LPYFLLADERTEYDAPLFELATIVLSTMTHFSLANERTEYDAPLFELATIVLSTLLPFLFADHRTEYVASFSPIAAEGFYNKADIILRGGIAW
jgi:hypothetical protein